MTLKRDLNFVSISTQFACQGDDLGSSYCCIAAHPWAKRLILYQECQKALGCGDVTHSRKQAIVYESS
jgi:hypothetical protein